MSRTVLRPVPDQVCGQVKVGATGIRWICVREPHGPDDPPPRIDPRWLPRAAHRFVRLEENKP